MIDQASFSSAKKSSAKVDRLAPRHTGKSSKSGMPLKAAAPAGGRRLNFGFLSFRAFSDSRILARSFSNEMMLWKAPMQPGTKAHENYSEGYEDGQRFIDSQADFDRAAERRR